MDSIDLLIIGGGPMGIATAIEARKRGLSVIILEKGYLVNSLYHFPTDMTFFSTSQRLEIGEVPFMSIASKPSRQEALEYYRRVVAHWTLDIRYGHKVMDVLGDVGAFQVKTDKQSWDCRFVVIATGFYDTPNRLEADGEQLDKVQYYFDDPHKYVGKRVAIVGAGNSACQAALALFHKDVQVDMIVRKSDVKASVKYWIRPDIKNRIAEGSITAHFRAVVKKLAEGQLFFEKDGTEFTIPNDVVMALIGYQPNYEQLSRWGIRVGDDEFRTPVYDEYQQSSRKGVYLAGVVCGGLKTNRFLIENSRDHAQAIINHILPPS